MMAQQQARDEAGNIWYVDDAGNPVGLAQAAPQGGASAIAGNPVQVQRQQVELGGAQLGNQRTAQQIALEAATAQATKAKAEADARKATADASKAERDLTTAPAESQAQQDRLSRLNQLARQINRTQSLYNTGVGTTKGIAGVRDYFPTDANARFDVAGNQLSQQGLAAFRVPGSGTVSDRDALMFDRANLPTASTRDAAIDEQLGGIRSRVEEEYRALGKNAPQWTQSIDRDPAAAIAATPSTGNNTPPGYDVASVGGGVGGGGSGGGFSNAAGVAMAQRLKAAYNRGAGVQDLNKMLQDNGFQPLSDAASIAAIQKRGRINFAPPQVDDTRNALGRAIGSVADSPLGAYAISAGDALTGGTLDNIAGGQAKLAQDYVAQQYPTASLAGTVTGGALAAGGAELGLARAGLTAGRAALAGDALYGGLYGAGSADNPGDSRLLGAAVGATGGALGGIAGRAAARGIGGALTGVQSADVRGLRAAGVPLTAGQALSQSGGAFGRGVQALENATTGIPGVGAVARGRYTEGFEGLNRAAFNEGLAPIGANTGGVVREQGIDAARAARSQAYGDALDNVQVQADGPFVQDMQGAIAAGRALPDPMSGNLDYTLPTRVGNSFDATGGLSGRDFQQSIRGLRRDARAVENLPYGHDFGEVTRQAEGALEGLLQRQSPGTLPAYNAANAANRNVEVLKDAVNRARSGTTTGDPGLFSAAQLSDAAAANARRFGGTQGTTRQPFYDLTRAAQRVLPSKVGDSGTATRAAVTAGLSVGGGAGVGYYGGGDGESAGYGAGGALALGALLAAGGSRPAQQLLVRGLLDHPQVAVQIGRGIQNRARIGGLFGAPLLAGTAPMLTQ